MNNTLDLAVFVQVVERGSFTAAAEHLELSKAAVSKYVARLERRVGVRLLHRTTRRLTLTEAGEVLFRRAGPALDEIDAATDAVQGLAGAPRGHLRVTAAVHLGQVYLAPMIAEFNRLYPDVMLELDLSNAMVDLVRDRFDVALRITDLANSTLVARRLADVRTVTCAAPGYLARRGIPRTPADLAAHDCLSYSLDRTPSEWHYRRRNGTPVAVRVSGGLRCNNDAALIAAAVAGGGVLHVPDLFIAGELESGRLVRVLDDYRETALTLAAVFPTRAQLAPKARAFVDFVAERIPAAVPR